ncbi:hypothetical protein EO95_13180 [Methanosarcina sp. 1.H.T.1A.1]|jgi:hypothetical protein|uniref:hypothetical protein n=1 Tax=unclassified Methanosarcina TaxID=2644672 RepID=UPI00062286A2|nr:MULTISPECIES: hypothetical protein [unclassified Methanosarcina]KKG10965.1 hypothetical protein EO92_09235 [Methanosarcina sp. 2.H.A.1B.4]KKH47232.1 hypothetical protein EO93_16970 [Methanosarcina sp. 1.H.A.2.2]KKH92043.1 hypothetical protein EO95_13180 [Methanosarcina sp. 1.H.T.1A.1]
MSIVKEKPQLDFVLKAHPGAIGQGIKQKDRSNNALKIYSCFKEFETANFETLNPNMKFSIQPGTYFVPSNTSTLSGKLFKVKESGFNFLQPAERSRLNFNQLTESYSIVTGRATEFCSCPEAPESGN